MKKYILLLFLGIACTLNAQKIEINVTHTHQDKSNWCVAAATKCVLDYYKKLNNQGKKISQCEIMEWVRTVSNGFGLSGCCSPDPPSPFVHPCDKEGVLLGYDNEKGSAKGIL